MPFSNNGDYESLVEQITDVIVARLNGDGSLDTSFNAGAGASVRLASQLWADVDARYFRLSRDQEIMRLGGGVSFRF